MYKHAKNGWYKLLNPEKFVKPIDEHMKSFKNGNVNYKSSLELKSFRYADFNKFITSWSVEPFAIKYVKPSDGKIHRYYIDMVLVFNDTHKILVEIKSSAETKTPRKPRKSTAKALANHQKALMTYAVNQAKWTAAKKFCELNDMTFTILTEKELG